MPFKKSERLARMLAVAIGVACAAASPSVAGGVDDASTLLASGRLVEAKRVLLALEPDSLSPTERERAYELLTAVERRMKHADPLDISLEKAELAIEEGDLREADRQAHAVRKADRVTADQRNRAADILTRSAEMKSELAPLAEAALAQASTDLEAGRYPEAKSGLEAVQRSGVRLTPDQLRLLDAGRQRIVEVERVQGRPFDVAPVSLGMLQPGKVTRRDDPAGQPASPDAAQPEQTQETDRTPPPPPPPPPAEDDEPQRTPAGDDPFQQAMRFDAQRFLTEADAAFEAGRLAEALQKYQEVIGPYRQFVSDEDAARATSRIEEIRVRVEQPGTDLLERQMEVRQVLADQTRAEFDNFLTEARTALRGGDFERARNLASQARVRLADSRSLFSEAEYNERLSRQQTLLQEISTGEEAARRTEVEQRERDIAEEARRQETAQREEKQRKINEALDRVRALQMEQKYAEAVQVIDQVLFLDPQNAAGLLLKDIIQDVMIYREWDQIQRRKNLSYGIESVRTQEAMILPQTLMEYPSDWPEISYRRGEPSAFTESPADRRVLAELDSRRIPASFTDNTLEDVLEFVATVTNLNIDVDWDSLADVGVSRDTLITLNLQPVPARVVLDRVLEKVSPDRFNRASWAANDGLLVVASDDDLRKNTFIVIYDVRDLLFQIPSFNEFPALDLDSVLNQREGGGAGSIFQNEEQQEGERLTKEELRERLLEIIQTTVDFEGWRDNGGDTGIIQELNDNLIITNTARNHRAISGLLQQLREVRSIQINVESRFLVVSQDFFEQIGFDIDVIFNAMNSQFDDALFQQTNFQGVITGEGPSGNTSLLPSDLIPAFFNPNTGNRASSLNEFVITNADDLDREQDIFGIEQTGYTVTRPDGLSMVPVNQNSLGLANSLINEGFAATVLGMNPALMAVGTFLDDIQVDFLVQATQADRRNVVLTAPRLTFTNGNAANIYVVTQQAFVSDLNPIVGTNSVAFDPTVDVASTGFTLSLDGIVSADRRYVTLTIQTQLAEIVGTSTQEVSAQTGGGTDAGAPGPIITDEFEIPIIQVTSIATGATIPDRGTLLIGGQRMTSEIEVETGVPVLSQIPIINRFFTNTAQSREEQTLLILVKPIILIQNEEEEKNFPGLLDSLENRFGAGQ